MLLLDSFFLKSKYYNKLEYEFYYRRNLGWKVAFLKTNKGIRKKHHVQIRSLSKQRSYTRKIFSREKANRRRLNQYIRRISNQDINRTRRSKTCKDKNFLKSILIEMKLRHSKERMLKPFPTVNLHIDSITSLLLEEIQRLEFNHMKSLNKTKRDYKGFLRNISRFLPLLHRDSSRLYKPLAIAYFDEIYYLNDSITRKSLESVLHHQKLAQDSIKIYYRISKGKLKDLQALKKYSFIDLGEDSSFQNYKEEVLLKFNLYEERLQNELNLNKKHLSYLNRQKKTIHKINKLVYKDDKLEKIRYKFYDNDRKKTRKFQDGLSERGRESVN